MIRSKKERRLKKKTGIRRKLNGTPERPRLCVFKSSRHVYAQIIDDEQRMTLVSASTKEKEYDGVRACNKAAAIKVGELIAKRAKEKGVTTVCFDRSGYLYHGRIKSLADSAREHGLVF